MVALDLQRSRRRRPIPALAAHDRPAHVALEELTDTAMRLARRNEELEDFGALVAHELKQPLLAALVADDASELLEQALDLVDALLEAGKPAASAPPFASAADYIDGAVVEYREKGIELTADLRTELPIAPTSLAVILRNLLANASAAAARHIHVATTRPGATWRLDVDDDGVGLEAAGLYASGSGLGMCLCSRIASRFGGVLEVTDRPFGGTRASLAFAGTCR